MAQIDSTANTPEELIGGFDYDLVNYKDVAETILRPELFTILQQSSQIQRFEGIGLPEKAIKPETVCTHTLRLTHRVDLLGLPAEIEEAVRLTLLLHDLPETQMLLNVGRTSDMTATFKSISPTEAHAEEATEFEVAKEIFTNSELELYQDFAVASAFLKGQSEIPPTTVGLIAKILDKIDADIFYHLAAASDPKALTNLNPTGQELAFVQYNSFSERLALLENTGASEAARLCQQLLNQSLLAIVEIWEKIPNEDVPDVIRENIKAFKLRTPHST